jgi:hypothetical protein
MYKDVLKEIGQYLIGNGRDIAAFCGTNRAFRAAMLYIIGVEMVRGIHMKVIYILGRLVYRPKWRDIKLPTKVDKSAISPLSGFIINLWNTIFVYYWGLTSPNKCNFLPIECHMGPLALKKWAIIAKVVNRTIDNPYVNKPLINTTFIYRRPLIELWQFNWDHSIRWTVVDEFIEYLDQGITHFIHNIPRCYRDILFLYCYLLGPKVFKKYENIVRNKFKDIHLTMFRAPKATIKAILRRNVGQEDSYYFAYIVNKYRPDLYSKLFDKSWDGWPHIWNYGLDRLVIK